MAIALAERIAGLQGWRADGCASAAGLLAAAALPPVHLVPVLLVAVPMLLRLIQASPSWAVAARRGWWFGFGLHVAGLYWVTEPIVIEAARFWWLVPFAVPLLAAVMALFIAAPAAATWCVSAAWPVRPRAVGQAAVGQAAVGQAALACSAPDRQRSSWQAVLTLAGSWVLADLARQFIATGFPWNPLGSVWEFPGYAGDVMVQLAALVGVHGMTLVTVLLAAAPVLRWPGWAGGVLVLAAWCGFGLVRLDQQPPPAPKLTVLLVQGNVAQGQKWDRALLVAIFHRYLDLTREAVVLAHDQPALVVWPETASPAQLQTDADARAQIADAARGAPALIGSVRFDPQDRPRNSLFALGAGGAIEGIYDKWHLVPFGEYQPDWLPIGIQVVPGGGFAAGPGPTTLHLAGVPSVGVLICYEAIFSGQVTDAWDRPAWIVNVTNDAWFGNSAGPRQHLAAVRLRAVEEGLPLLRAANTGISAGFDAYGRELGRVELRTTGVLVVDLPGALPPTVYSRSGLLLPLVLSGFSLIVGLLPSVLRRWRRRVNFDPT